MKKVVLFFLRLYQRLLNSSHWWTRPFFLPGSGCRFRPSCSQYCAAAITRYGILKGGWRCLRRLSRCHPWSRGGWDPVQ